MKGFDAKFIDEVKNKTDIVDFIGKYVRLEQRGRSFWGCCPFHHEKTPSFCINATEQFYHCFGCHKSGDVITFAQEIENLDFIDAVKFLAERAGLAMPEIDYDSEAIKEQKQKRQRLTDLMRETAMFYVKNLRLDGASKHREYLVKRGYGGETVNKFGIGASLDFNSLPKHLLSKGFTYSEMLDSGAVSTNADGKYYDALGGRLIVPIINQFNQVIAFGGRVLEKVDYGKYKNTKDTPLFNKSNVLYNLNNVKKLKNEKGLDSLIMVEGYMDTISLVSAGIQNVVASMGTALTKEQARIIKRYVGKVYISYDGDSAGQTATLRGLEILSSEGLEVKVVALPDGLDPDDVVKKLGADAYRELLLNAKPLIDFKLDLIGKKFDLSTTDGKRKYVAEACKIIKESPSAVEQEDLLKTVRDITGFTFDALKRQLYAEQTQPVETVTIAPKMQVTGDKIAVASRFVLYSYLFNKEYAKEQDINEIDFDTFAHIFIKNYIVERQNSGEKIRFTDLYELLADDEQGELNYIANMDTEDSKIFDKETFFLDSVIAIKKYSLDKRISELKRRYTESTETSIRQEIASELNKLLLTKNLLK